jgi:hypothetical protein
MTTVNETYFKVKEEGGKRKKAEHGRLKKYFIYP